MALNKEQILAARDIQIEEFYVPEWDGSIYIKTMTAEERDKFEEAIFIKDGGKRKADVLGLRAKLCAFVICDAEGNRLFSESEVEALSKKSAAALTRIFEKSQELSATREGDLEELVKNSESVQGEDSSSD